jgi:hypothetical protein
MGILLGASDGVFPEVSAAVPNCTDRRYYYDAPNGWSTSWPVVEGTTATVSIRPFPGALLQGTFDDSLRIFLSSAPKGNRLTAFHEASNLLDYRIAPWLRSDGSKIVTAQSMRATHAYLRDFCHDKKNNPNGVTYGVVMCCPPSQMAPWMVEGLDWYGVDIYDWAPFHFNGDINQPLDINGALTKRFEDWHVAVQQVSGQSAPHLNVCETNSDYESHRPKWFSSVAKLLGGFTNGHVMDTFWGGENDGWLPGDTDTINTLKGI